jgi:hypothetical protein
MQNKRPIYLKVLLITFVVSTKLGSLKKCPISLKSCFIEGFFSSARPNILLERLPKRPNWLGPEPDCFRSPGFYA